MHSMHMHTVKYANNTLEYANTEKLHLPIFVNTSYERVKSKVLDNVVQDHKVHMPLYFAMKIRSSFIVSIKLKEQMEAKRTVCILLEYCLHPKASSIGPKSDPHQPLVSLSQPLSRRHETPKFPTDPNWTTHRIKFKLSTPQGHEYNWTNTVLLLDANLFGLLADYERPLLTKIFVKYSCTTWYTRTLLRNI